MNADWQYYVQTETQVAVGVAAAIKNIYCAMIIMMMIE